MTERQDWLDELLRTGRPAPVADQGFTARVVARLPARSRATRQWVLPSTLAVGAVSAILVSGARVDLVAALQLLIAEHRVSITGFLPVLLALACCAWALAESK